MSFCLQLRLLLWKNFTLRKRQPIRIIVEILWPLIFFLILVWVKLDNSDLQVHQHECHFDGKAMPSAGFMPFFQSVFCTANNTCHRTLRPEESPGNVNVFNTSILSELFRETEFILSELSDSKLIEKLPEDFETIQELMDVLVQCNFTLGQFVNVMALRKQLALDNVTFSQESLDMILNSNINTTELLSIISENQFDQVNGGSDLRHLVCDKNALERIFIFPAHSNKKLLKKELCSLTSTQFQSLINDLYSSISVDLAQNQVQKCMYNKLGFFSASLLGLRLISVRNDFEDIRDLYFKIEGDLSGETFNSLSSKIRRVQDLLEYTPNSSIPSPENMNNGTRMLHAASLLLCQSSESIFNQSYQGDSDYLAQAAELQKDQENNVNNGPGIERTTHKNSGNQTVNSFNYDNTTTPFCNDIFHLIEQSKNPGIRILWRQMKPLIRGKIPYTPDTPLTRRIIKQANWTFEYMARIQKLARDWVDAVPKIRNFMMSSPQVNRFRNLVYVASSIYPGKERIQQLRDWLQVQPMGTNHSNWQNTLNTSETAMSFVAEYLECFQFDKFEPLKQESDLVRVGLKYIEDQLLWAGLVFDVGNNISLSEKGISSYISFKIRMDSARVDSTQNFKVIDKFWSPGPRARPVEDMKYIMFGFAYLQDMVEHALIQEQTGTDDIGIAIQQFPYPCYMNDRFTKAISRIMPLFMTLAWIFSVSMIVKGIVYEKEQRLKEVMKVMGLGNGVHWLAWFITSFITMLASVILLAIVLKAGRVLENSDGVVIFLFIMAFSLATISQCFMFSVFFSKANLAAACAGIFYFIGHLPYSLCIQWEEYMLGWQKALACLSSTVAFGFGSSYIARYEEQGLGIQWYNIRSSPLPEDTFSLSSCTIMMLVDAVIYFVITWYVEAVHPGQFGVPKPWYFCFTKTYWCGTRCTSSNLLTNSPNIELHYNQTVSGDFEPEPRHLNLGVAIKGLFKVYKKGQKPAVNNLDLNFYEGQITSFLGHNGAGKTTTMSILTGLFPPTHGTALVYGKDIRFEMDDIHKDMGMCPQHNVLFDSLTVEEHLYFYSSLKGMKKPEQEVEVKKMIADVGLPHKKHALASSLSGGMKRKLSIAVAFTAGSRVVILDEPTAGVDPYARRSIWDLLLKYKTGRTIILSTHFMDEADILGDRIAIISQGELCCCGSSLFLKSIYGNGYYLTFTVSDGEAVQHNQNGIAVNNSAAAANNVALGTGDSLVSLGDVFTESQMDNKSTIREQALVKIIRSHIPASVLVENIASEFTFHLPDDKESVAKFDKLFSSIDNNMAGLGISGYGISNTTLEEVFLKVEKLSGINEENEEAEREELEVLMDGGSSSRPTTRLSFRRVRQSLRSLIRKKRLSNTCQNGNVMDDGRVSDSNSADFPEISESMSLLGNSSFSEEALEDVVAGSEGDNDVRMEAEEIPRVAVSSGVAESCQVTGASLIWRQFTAIFIKRFLYIRRNKKAFLSQIVLPAIFISLAMIFSKINPPVPELPAMEVHPWLMTPKKLSDSHLYVFFSNDETSEAWTQEMEQLLMTRPGLGMRCMNPEVHSISGYSCDGVFAQLLNESTPFFDDNETRSCSCETGSQQCPPGVSGPEPEKFLLANTDYVYNMTHGNITDWLVKTTQDYRMKRYGGLSFGETNRLVVLNKTQLEDLCNQLLTATSTLQNSSTLLPHNRSISSIIEDFRFLFSRIAISQNAKIWFDNTGYVSMISYMNAMNNFLLRANLASGSDPAKYGISVVSHPMNRTKAQTVEYAIRASGVDVLISISVIFALSLIPASFILFLIEERKTGSKHLQFVSGVNPTVYWCANFIWDMCNYMVSATICVLLFIAFQQKEFVSSDNVPCLIALLFLYGWAITPMMYPVSYVFSVPSTAFVVMGSLNIFIGILSTLSTFILEVFMEERLDRINNILRRVFLVLPHFCLGRGLIDMTRNQIIADVFAAFGEDIFKNPLSWDLVGKNLFFLFIQGIGFFIFTLCVQYQFWYHKLPCIRMRYTTGRQISLNGDVLNEEDIDVAAERIRVTSGRTEQDVLTVEGLTKVYLKPFSRKLHTAVRNLNVGVKRGECFGLLGVNGAGKTTTFKMLTGDTAVTSGDAHLAGHSILTDMVSANQQLGYCPQFDALCSLLTVTEHLQLYARLRGIPERDVGKVTAWAICRLGLVLHKNKCAADLSGGNRRKLSTAIALVGNPSVIFLDEPTTGMDPKARRFLWNCINSITKDGRSVVLTSHSMEECEALCDRIAIMVNGSFQCLGSIQHLKNRFGDGYTVMVRLSGERPEHSHLKRFISETFPTSQLKEQHHNMLHYQFTSKKIPLSFIFGTLEAVRERFSIEDYSVSQTTLDQVFINFAKLQKEVKDDEEIAVVAVMNGIQT